jgi:hypothetical protein
MTTQLQVTQAKDTEVFFEVWTYDEARSKRWEKPIFVTTIKKLQEEGLYDPWYDEIPTKTTWWYADAEKTKISVLSHKTKNPNGVPVGLVVLNMSFEEEL